MKIQVGQKLWWVGGNGSRSQYEVEVVTVGRKWATINPGNHIRINIDTGHADGKGYMSPGQCWESREAYEAHTERVNTWFVIWSSMQHQFNVPENISTENIRAAAKLLGIEFEKKEEQK